MSEGIIITLIGIAGSLITSCITNFISNKNFTNMVSYRIEQLEKKQDIHNGVIERVYKLEQHSAVTDEILKEIKEKIA